ncbi:MAG: tRNA adenosine(34) deaminase TadA [Candidatus Omnitrophica bacterium]|nr:tRNA adenosine(34) deaminase TadA [Candidatus Omnitrophota bacterium]
MSKIKEKDKFFMKEALKEAEKALEKDEVPVGAIIVHKGKIIARAHNQMRTLNDPTAHAEMIAITSATSILKDMRLLDCTLYVTIEPCSMCAGALVLARLQRIVYGAEDPKTGACGSVLNIVQNAKLNHRIKITRGILREECSRVIQQFFQIKRRIKAIMSN